MYVTRACQTMFAYVKQFSSSDNNFSSRKISRVSYRINFEKLRLFHLMHNLNQKIPRTVFQYDTNEAITKEIKASSNPSTITDKNIIKFKDIPESGINDSADFQLISEKDFIQGQCASNDSKEKT